MPDDVSISGLEETSNPSAGDVLPIVSEGATRKVSITNLTKAIPAATGSTKGAMTPAQVSLLVSLAERVSYLEEVNSAQLTAASTITIPSGVSYVLLSGDTEVTSIQCPDDYKVYILRYVQGNGVTVLGKRLEVGDAVLLIGGPTLD